MIGLAAWPYRSFGDCFRASFVWCFAAVLLCMAWSWLNPNLFVRSSELMFQGSYQARLFTGTFFEPAVSYIPTPGANPKLDSAWALTFRFTFLF
jgi:hypothetical protein